jgi:hypothetical protein
VALVCFTPPKAQTLYMFVMNESAIRRKAPGPTPILQSVNGITTAHWSRDGHVYLLAADPNPVDLRKL